MNIKIHGCVGGTAVREDMRILQDGVHIVVGTPGNIAPVLLYGFLEINFMPIGRVHDMINRRALRLDSIQLFVLDEADEMLR